MELAVRILAQFLAFVHVACAKCHRAMWSAQAVNCKVLKAGMRTETESTVHQQFCGWNQWGSTALWWVFPDTEEQTSSCSQSAIRIYDGRQIMQSSPSRCCHGACEWQSSCRQRTQTVILLSAPTSKLVWTHASASGLPL